MKLRVLIMQLRGSKRVLFRSDMTQEIFAGDSKAASDAMEVALISPWEMKYLMSMMGFRKNICNEIKIKKILQCFIYE